MQIFISLCFAVLFGFAGVQASFSNALSGFTSTMSGIGNGFKQFGEGMAQSFGAAPSGYHYSFRVFNNTVADTVTTSWNNLVKFQGIVFNEGTSGATVQTLFPTTDTGSLYSNIKLYLEVEVSFTDSKSSFTDVLANSASNYADATDGLGNPITFYNVYTQVDTINGVRSIIGPQVEYMGVTGPNSLSGAPKGSYITLTSDFNGLIYNGVNQQNSILFSYSENSTNIKKYTIVMDPMSFNFLANDPLLPNSIRPTKGTGALTFFSNGPLQMSSQNSATISPLTFGPASWDSTTKTVTPSFNGSNTALRSNYEIFNNQGSLEVIQTGFQPGNFLINSGSKANGISPVNAPGSITPSYLSIIPVSSQMRNITPVRCLIWNQSAEQYNAQMAVQNGVAVGSTEITTAMGVAFVPFNDQNSTLWFVYYAPGWSTDSQVKSNGVLQTLSNGVTWAAPKSMPGLLLGQIPSGQAISFSIIRPLLNYKCSLTPLEGAQWTIQAAPVITPPPITPSSSPTSSVPVITPPSFLPATSSLASAARLSIVALNTTDVAKAQQFLIRLASEKIKFSVFTPSALSDQQTTKVQNFSYAQQSALLSKPLPTNVNYLTDQGSGVTGVLLATDIFSSYGNSCGPFYYTIYPPQLDIGLPVGVMISNLNSDAYKAISAQDSSGNYTAYSSLLNNVATWVLSALNSPSTAQESLTLSITQYLQVNGISDLFTSTGAGKSITQTNVLSTFGNSVVQQIINGPGGLAHPLKFYMSGTNNWLWTEESVPSAFEKSNGETVNISVSAWNPANTVPVG